MSERNYCIYKHTSPSGKSYIGQTINYENRCRKHKSIYNKCPAFAGAIKKYGWDNFTHEILHINLTYSEANYMEQYEIQNNFSLSPNGYNLTTGGLNCKYSDETLLKMSNISKNMSTATKQKISKTKLEKGYVATISTKQKLSDAYNKRIAILRKINYLNNINSFIDKELFMLSDIMLLFGIGCRHTIKRMLKNNCFPNCKKIKFEYNGKSCWVIPNSDILDYYKSL